MASVVVRRRCRFFPKMVDILDVVKENRNRVVHQNLLLDYEPEQLTNDQVSAKFNILKRQLAGDLSMEEASNKMAKV